MDLNIRDLAATAQVRHEAYLDGDLAEEDEPDVDDEGSEGERVVEARRPEERGGEVDWRAGPLHKAKRTLAGREEAGIGEDEACTQSERRRKRLHQPGELESNAVNEESRCASRSKSARSKAYSKRKRNAARDKEAASHEPDPYSRTPKQCAKKHKQRAQAVRTEYTFVRDVNDRRVPVAKTGFTGKPEKKGMQQSARPAEDISKTSGIEDHDLTLFDWDGRYAH